MERKTEKIYTRIGPELFRRFRIRAAELGLSLPDAFEEAIEAWVSATGAQPNEITEIRRRLEELAACVAEMRRGRTVTATNGDGL